MASEILVEDPEPISPTVTAPTQTWAPPRFPLPPHRLAALANALGVSTPLPATRRSPSFMSSSSSFPGSMPSSDHNWRSPTPSSASTHNFSSYSPSSSKFLLHVTPPLHLPHESNSTTENSELTPPPSNASGYHTQFRRGTLVPLHATLQSQMVAIAKEYALPSTAGMILYLASASATRSAQPSPTPPSPSSINGDNADEPGPRLSEDVWKHMWARVLRAEREEHLVASRSPTPNFGLGLNLGIKSSACLTQDNHVQPLRPMFSPSCNGPISQVSRPAASPITPSASTSSSYDLRSNSLSKSIAPSFSSRSQSEPQTPDTSSADEQELDLRAKDLHLPGLDSPSIIPILAKVEFDIDRKKAGWYEPWIRSRKRNHLKRTGSKKTQLPNEGKVAPIKLKLAGRIIDGGYKPLSESPEHTDTEADPLAEVFGTDADTWADIHADNESRGIVQHQDPKVVQLALNGADLTALPDQCISDEEEDKLKDEDEVMELLEKMNRPRLSISIPSSPTSTAKRRSSPTTAGTLKKPIPPPLVLSDLPGDSSPMHGENTHLPYLAESTPGDETFISEDGVITQRSHLEEKREGGVFEDLDLGLGDYSYDEYDPHDRRKSQLLMKAKLDEIERALAQFSPNRIDQITSEGDPPSPSVRSGPLAIHSSSELHLGAELPPKQDEPSSAPAADRSSSLKAKHHTVRYENAQGKARLNEETVPSAPGWSELSSRKKQNRNTFKLEGSTFPRDSVEAEASWPAVPAPVPVPVPSMESNSDVVTSTQPMNIPSSPPRLAVNGVSAPASRPTVTKPNPKDVVSSESIIWTRAFEEKKGSYSPPGPQRKGSSPIIPLSPDPFGRYSSDTREISRNVASAPSKHKVVMSHSSRFSSDSITEATIPKGDKGDKGGASLVGVKSVKRLWRKSKKLSISGSQALTGSGKSSPNPPPLPGSAKEHSMLPPLPRSPLPPSDPLAPRVKHARVDSALDHFHFDQESPYPLHKPARPSISERPPSQALPSTSGPARESIHKSILKSWKGASTQPQPPGATLEPRVSTERRPSGEASRSSTNEPLRPRRPSVLEIASSLRASISSTADIPPSPQLPVQYVQNGHVSGLSERRKSKPKAIPTSSTDLSQYSSPPTRPPLLSASTSPPRSMMSASSRDSEDTRPSFDVSQFEMVSPKMNSSLSYPYHALDHDGQ